MTHTHALIPDATNIKSSGEELGFLQNYIGGK